MSQDLSLRMEIKVGNALMSLLGRASCMIVTVVVAMSGGVDSSVVAKLLSQKVMDIVNVESDGMH